MSIFEPPPTYADPVLINEKEKPGSKGYSKFNPIWLKWFLDITQVLTNAGGGSGSIQHNNLLGLQGGGASERYHLGQSDATNVGTIASGLNVTITTAKLTAGGANGSMTFTKGILTAQTPAT